MAVPVNANDVLATCFCYSNVQPSSSSSQSVIYHAEAVWQIDGRELREHLSGSIIGEPISDNDFKGFGK
jgi:hypothetical protein